MARRFRSRRIRRRTYRRYNPRYSRIRYIARRITRRGRFFSRHGLRYSRGGHASTIAFKCQGCDYSLNVPKKIMHALKKWAGLILKLHVQHHNNGVNYDKEVYHAAKKNLVEEMLHSNTYTKWALHKNNEQIMFVGATMPKHQYTQDLGAPRPGLMKDGKGGFVHSAESAFKKGLKAEHTFMKLGGGLFGNALKGGMSMATSGIL